MKHRRVRLTTKTSPTPKAKAAKVKAKLPKKGILGRASRWKVRRTPIKLPTKLIKRRGGQKGPGAYLLAADGSYIAGTSEARSARWLAIVDEMASLIKEKKLLTPHDAQEWIAKQF